jgi:NADPH-dependent ferric siderophore reductase
MMMAERFTLSGTAIPVDPQRMLEEICEHFVEHADVFRRENGAKLITIIGNADIDIVDNKLAIEIDCPAQKFIVSARSMIAEHLFEFAGDEPLELTWAEEPNPDALPSFREATVVETKDITPHMRRVTVSCRNVEQFIGVGLHVRLLIPQGAAHHNRAPAWPGMLPDGRVAWPDEKEMAVRIYTIRSVDLERGQLDIDFVLHESDGQSMPGAEFAMEAKPGDVIGIMGPGGDGVAHAGSLILAGDEAALPAIGRMVAEALPTSTIRAFIEVDNAAEEQELVSPAKLEITWLHRNGGKAGTMRLLEARVKEAAETASENTYIWAGCEKTEARAIRDFLKARGHDRKQMSISAYWQKPKVKA